MCVEAEKCHSRAALYSLFLESKRQPFTALPELRISKALVT